MDWFVYFEPVAKQYSVWQRNTDNPDDDTLVSAKGIPEKVAYEIAALPDIIGALEHLVECRGEYAIDPSESAWKEAKDALDKAANKEGEK